MTQTFIGESDTKAEQVLLKVLPYTIIENQVSDANKCLDLYIKTYLNFCVFFNSLQNGVNQ